MSEQTTTTRPDVEAFVARVRARLADLGEDDREELLDGLEADLSEQLADGSTDLGDPWLYAAELRAAAGLPEPRRSRPVGQLLPRRADLERALDRSREVWSDLLGRFPSQVGEVLSALRPAWWVARAWVAVSLLDQWAGPWERVSLMPTLAVPGLGLAVLVVAIVVSTLIGLGRLWPGSGPDRPLTTRLLLLAANLAALVLPLGFSATSPGYLSGEPHWDDPYSYYYASEPEPGLRVDGAPVRNIFAYDAEGRPLTGVQLFRANGEALAVTSRDSVTRDGRTRTVGCGWLNGTTQLFNVFPLGQREQRRGRCAGTDGDLAGPVTEAVPPFAQVPPVTSPITAPAAGPVAVPPGGEPAPTR